MNRRSRIARLVGGVALLGTFLTWLVLRADLMELIGHHDNLFVGLVLHMAALLLLTGGVSLIATGVTTSSARSPSPAQTSVARSREHATEAETAPSAASHR